MQKSAFFEPYRPVGFVTDSIPFSLKRLGQENFVSVVTGKSWQVFNCDKLRLALVAPQREHRVTAIASFKDVTFTGCGREIIVWKRTHEATRITPPMGSTIVKLMTIGTTLISLSEDLQMYVWDCSSMTKLFSTNELTDAQDEAAKAAAGEKIASTTAAADAQVYKSLRLEPNVHIAFPRPIEDQDATITSIVHPPTYMNKIVVGWSNGDLELVNIRSGKTIHRFKNLDKLSDPSQSGKGLTALQDSYSSEKTRRRAVGTESPAAITCIAKSPIVDVIAVGRASGSIILFNMKYDEPIHAFYQADGPVTSLSFRSDGKAYLASGATTGHITVWDLEQKRIHTTMRSAHNSRVISLEFLAGEPLLLSSGADNAIHEWAFDQTDNTSRLLRSRAGHSAPPSQITFYNEDIVLSSGSDRTLRAFHINRDQMSCEMSQGSLAREARLMSRSVESIRLPRVTSIASNSVRDRDFPSIITTHAGDSAGMTWSNENKSLSQTKLVNLNGLHSSPATASAVSACGHFGLVGSADGRIEKFNMQSGLYRGRYGVESSAHLEKGAQTIANKTAAKTSQNDARIAVKIASQIAGATRTGVVGIAAKLAEAVFGSCHSAAITGLYSDSMNRQVISTSVDHSIRFWDFTTFACKSVIGLGCPVALTSFCADSELIACATDDLLIHVVDTEAHRVVRRFRVGHRLTSLAFSPDGRILVASQANGEVRVYDLPSGRMVDWFAFVKPVTSLAFSPKADFLATTHVGSVGVFLWVNRSYFSHTFLGLSIPERPTPMELVSNTAYSADAAENTLISDEQQSEEAIASAAAIRAAGDSSEDDSDEESDKETKEPPRKMRKIRTSEGEVIETDDVVSFAICNPIDPRQMRSEVWGDLITLSGLPASKWQQLSMLDAIRQRNKPKEAPKAPVAAPFFLGVASGVVSALDVTETKEAFEKENRDADELALSRILVGQVGADNAFVRLLAAVPSISRAYVRIQRELKKSEKRDERLAKLLAGNSTEEDDLAAAGVSIFNKDDSDSDNDQNEDKQQEDDDEDEEDDQEKEEMDSESDLTAVNTVTTYLASLSPSSIDAEIRSLAVGAAEPEDVPKLFAVMRYLLIAIRRRKDYEFIQALCHLFLKIHAEAVGAHTILAEQAQLLERAQKQTWTQLEQFFHSSICMLNNFCNIHA